MTATRPTYLHRSSDHRDYQRVPRVVTAMARDTEHGVSAEPHSHERAQLLYATEGLMRVQTEFGVWILPPRRALMIAPGVVHHWTSIGKVTMRTIYIEAGAATAFGEGCRVVEVSPLLRELILALLTEPVEYPLPGRGEHLAMLILSELAAAETVPMAIPWPRDRRLLAVCSAIMDDPGSTRTIEDWAADVGASARTLIRLSPRRPACTTASGSSRCIWPRRSAAWRGAMASARSRRRWATPAPAPSAPCSAASSAKRRSTT